MTLCLMSALLIAQTVQVGPRAVMPERPTVATHAHTVAPGYLEIETGLERDRFDDGTTSAASFTNVKVGLSGHAQLNILLPLVGGGFGSLGAGDVGVGVKWRVLDAHPLLGDFALLPTLKFATGSPRLGRGTGTTDATLTLVSSRTLGPVSMDLNVAWTIRSGDGSAASKQATLWTASFGGPLYRSVGWVFEYFGYPATSGPAGSTATSSLLFGPTLLMDRTLSVDAGAIVPLSGPQSYGLYAGLTWNVGHLVGLHRRPQRPE